MCLGLLQLRHSARHLPVNVKQNMFFNSKLLLAAEDTISTDTKAVHRLETLFEALQLAKNLLSIDAPHAYQFGKFVQLITYLVK